MGLPGKQSHFHYSSKKWQILAFPATLATMTQIVSKPWAKRPPTLRLQVRGQWLREQGAFSLVTIVATVSCQVNNISIMQQQHPRTTPAVGMQAAEWYSAGAALRAPQVVLWLWLPFATTHILSLAPEISQWFYQMPDFLSTLCLTVS